MLTIYRSPKVTLISRPTFLHPEHLPCDFIGDASDGERLAEYAGRVCYMSYSNPARRDNAAYLRNIIESHHGSVLENVSFSFLLEGVSRSLTHELIRHRAGTALSQLSQRFVDESDAAFVMPPAIQGDVVLEAEWTHQCELSLDAYGHLVALLMDKFADVEDRTLRRKRARESARSVLPNATETKLVWTANLRALRHIIELRGSEHADLEIQALARELLAIMRVEAPNVFFDFIQQTAGNVTVTNSKV